MLYIISYDLRKPGQDYKNLYAALKKISAKRVMQSLWAVKRINTNPVKLRDYLRTFVDADDRLLVATFESSDWASWNAMVDFNTV